MKFGKINISKKLIVKLSVFLILIVSAILVDVYLNENPADFDNIEAGTQTKSPNQGEILVLAQSVSFSVKTMVQKAPERKLKVEAHNKFLQNYHSVRDFQVLKAEVIQKTTPLITSYHYLVFLNHLFSPDKDPLS